MGLRCRKVDDDFIKKQKMSEGGKKGSATTTKHALRVVSGRYVDSKSPVAETLKKCSECAIRGGCAKFNKNARCYYQIKNLHASYKKQDALTSGDPRDLLVDIQTTIDKLEEAMRFHEEEGIMPTKNDLKELAFLKLQVYEMLYGRKPIASQVNVNAPVVDVKSMMSELREKKVVDVKSEVK